MSVEKELSSREVILKFRECKTTYGFVAYSMYQESLINFELGPRAWSLDRQPGEF